MVVAVSAGSAEELHSAWVADPETLLLVEDDPADRVLVEELLADSGIRTTLVWARTLAEAKDRLDSDGIPSCILLDLHLPDGRGMEVVSQVLAVAPAAAIVVLTGLAEENAGLAAVAAGAQDYLIKGQAAPHAFGRAIRYAAQRKHVEQASAALRVSEVRAEENARLERGLLPTPLLRTEGIEVVARYRPGREQSLLGGDFYDVVETDDGTVHAVIGDVAGHGPAEAATGVCLRVAWRSLVLAGVPMPALISLLEQMLVAEREGDRVFATLSYLAFTPDRRRVRVLRAGHPGLLRRMGDGVDLVEDEVGPALGLVTGHGWRDQEMPLPPGASLVLFTDGLFWPWRGSWPGGPRPRSWTA
jgi:CheY-like chemotaxis protein